MCALFQSLKLAGIVLVLASCSQDTSTDQVHWADTDQTSVSDQWNILAPNEQLRAIAERDFAEAEAHLRQFAEIHGFSEYVSKIRARGVVIYEDKRELDDFISRGLPLGNTIPPTVVAVYRDDEIHVLVEDAALAQDERNSDHADYIAVLVHELAHGLHLAIVGENPAALGPQWFREGVAIVAADQFMTEEISDDRFQDIVSGASGRDYVMYGAAVRRLVKHVDFDELLDRAQRPGFDSWCLMTVGIVQEME